MKAQYTPEKSTTTTTSQQQGFILLSRVLSSLLLLFLYILKKGYRIKKSKLLYYIYGLGKNDNTNNKKKSLDVLTRFQGGEPVNAPRASEIFPLTAHQPHIPFCACVSFAGGLRD